MFHLKKANPADKKKLIGLLETMDDVGSHRPWVLGLHDNFFDTNIKGNTNKINDSKKF